MVAAERRKNVFSDSFKNSKTLQFIFISPLLQSLGCWVQLRELSSTDPKPLISWDLVISLTSVEFVSRRMLQIQQIVIIYICPVNIRLVRNQKSMQAGAFRSMCFT